MDTQPAFIAVEASEQVYKELKCQRNHFEKKANAEFPQLPEAVIEDLSITIYYEADVCLKAFPNEGIIWLDANRWINEESLSKYAEERLNIYKPILNIQGDILKRISLKVWNKNWEKPPETPLGEPDYDRDFIFHKTIKEAISTHQGEWAIIIVGASHSAMRDNSVRVLLEKDHFDCTVTVLKPRLI